MTDVSLRARFERFPATVKGAFVVRGEGTDPHQVAMREARVVRVPGAAVRDVPITVVTVDVPPHKDVFVPFELPIAELEPGWYAFEVDMDVDGSPRTVPGGRSFCVPWPRSAVRSATLRPGRDASMGGAGSVSVERCQSGPEGLALRVTVQPPQPLAVRLFADDAKLDVVDQEQDPQSGRTTVRAYPLLRSHRSLRIELAPQGDRGEKPARIELDLS